MKKIKRESLPLVRSIREVYSFEDSDAFDHVGSFVIIAPDTMSGRRNRYSVIRVDYQTGQAERIGCEVDLTLAREIAMRPSSEDGLPLVKEKRNKKSF